MDHVGPFVTTPTGNKYILVMVDNLTKFTCLIAAKDTSADGVIDSLTTLVQTFGLPNRMVTDRGTCFTGRKFEEFCDEKGIEHTITLTQIPQANGQVTKEDEWDQWLPEVQREINNSESKVTRKTPFELLHGYRPRFRLGKTRASTETTDTWTYPDELRKKTREASEKAKEKMKEDYDLHRHDNTKYVVGEIIVMTTVPSYTGQSSKLQNKYKGPLTITELLPGDVYRVAQQQEDQKRLLKTTTHVSQLKSWRLEEELDETSSHEDEEDRGPNDATSSEDEDVQSLTERKSNIAEKLEDFRHALSSSAGVDREITGNV
ncbi:hypothetical protein QTP88_014844 [Uroleucon formosanum]